MLGPVGSTSQSVMNSVLPPMVNMLVSDGVTVKMLLLQSARALFMLLLPARRRSSVAMVNSDVGDSLLAKGPPVGVL